MTPSDQYRELLSIYINKINRDLGLEEKGIGIIVLFMRVNKKGGTDMASNLCDKDIATALEDILKTMEEKNNVPGHTKPSKKDHR